MKFEVYGNAKDLRDHVATWCGEYEIEFHTPGNAETWARELVAGLIGGAKYVARYGSLFDTDD